MSQQDNSKRSIELSRRDILRLGAGAALVLPLGSLGCTTEGEPPVTEGLCDVDPAPADNATPLTTNPADVPANETLFALGATSGSITQTGAIVWSHADDNQPKTLQVWRTDAAGARWLAHESLVTPVDGYLKADVSGLAANTLYQYAFFAGTEARSSLGQFRTAYGDDCRRPLTVAATTCTSLSNKPFDSLQVMAKQDYDVFCHLGDMSYNDGAKTTEEFRAKWRETLKEPGYRAVLAKSGMYITWDDHEFTDSGTLYNQSQEFMATARNAFYETLPVRDAENGRLWRSYTWGQTVEFIVLDCRTERDPSTLGTGQELYISQAQMDWFKERLRTSKAHFKIVLNSVPILRFPDLWIMQNDRWQGYESQRNELLDFITDNNIRNVWFLSGDFHVGTVARLELEGPRSKYWEILVGPGANVNPLTVIYNSGGLEERESIAPAAQFNYFSGEFAATLLTFDPLTDSVRIRFLGTQEQVLFDQTLKQE